jgi:hypothetical protein
MVALVIVFFSIVHVDVFTIIVNVLIGVFFFIRF